ncbi:MAG: ATP-binding cassette domain-containing protein [Coriobacteriales bacterium]|nr:ATP-binding cassette domain-containing protein [Coriobacteriales bacterium]
MTDWFESQIETRAKLDKQLTEKAYAKLADSVCDPGQSLDFDTDSLEAADGAVRACLKYNGIEAGTVPEDIVDLNEHLDWLCRPAGVMRRDVQLKRGWQKQAFGAMLGKLKSGEAVALLPQGIRGYYYIDPVNKCKVKVTSKTCSNIEQEAILFYRPLPAKPLTIRDLAAFIFRIFDRNDYLLVLVAGLIVAAIGLLPAWANQVAFDVVAPSGQARLILPIAALLLGVAVSTALIGACRSLVMARVSAKLDIITEAATFARILALPSSFFKQYASGDLGNRISSVTSIAQTIVTTFLGSGLSAFLSLIYIFQIGAFAPALALPALVIVIIQSVLTIMATLVTIRYEKEKMTASAKLSGTVTALLNGIQKIKLAGAENRAFAKWADGYAEYARPVYNRPVFIRALPAIVALVALLGNIAIYYFAGSTGVSIANYMAFNTAYGQVTAAIMAFAGIAGQIAQIQPLLSIVSPILEATPEIAEDKPSVESLTGGIEVSGLTFRYNENAPYILQNLSFKINPGEYVALVGKSGCGKSTILRLLLGFETPERGSIFYGPYNIQKINLRSLRRHIGVVMQDGKLFMGDISNNITISNPSATLDDAWQAAELAGIADDIRKMPMGMQTLITEGSGGVSGGQRQRLMIARAVCGKRRILMFDEATSALDNLTQKHVAESLENLKCTRIVVAHRLSTVRHCDRILVIDNGNIAEEGTYEELIAKNGVFAELVKRQRLDKEG